MNLKFGQMKPDQQDLNSKRLTLAKRLNALPLFPGSCLGILLIHFKKTLSLSPFLPSLDII
ncbi:MAG: hypothetical protein B6D54_00895 [Epsilonproteobacteria bacterium 4484_65]|nr:MAG: hypothetical protein B6D54_00895 [Epsilonproteobacteria bacterium 4484_65]